MKLLKRPKGVGEGHGEREREKEADMKLFQRYMDKKSKVQKDVLLFS